MMLSINLLILAKVSDFMYIVCIIIIFHQQRSPLGKACTFGRLEVVNLLLERGAEVKPRALEDALKEGYEYASCLGVPSQYYRGKLSRHRAFRDQYFHRNYFGLPC